MRLWNAEHRSRANAEKGFESQGTGDHVHAVESFSALSLESRAEASEGKEHLSAQLAAQSEKARRALSDFNLHTLLMDRGKMPVKAYGNFVEALVTTILAFFVIAVPLFLAWLSISSNNPFLAILLVLGVVAMVLFYLGRPR